MFFVSDNRELVEQRWRRGPQELGELPVTISGQVLKIEEVDFYSFRTSTTGPVTCEVFASRVGSPLKVAVQVRDSSGELVADVVDTEGNDLSVTFAARAGSEYVIRLHDLDFAGNRSFVYRLHVSQGPRIVAARPSHGKRGATQEVELIGYGIKSGRPQLETLTRTIEFPSSVEEESFNYTLKTLDGEASWSFPLSDVAELCASELDDESTRLLPSRGAVTATLPTNGGVERYRLNAKKGDLRVFSLRRTAHLSDLDLHLTLFGPDGKVITKNDDFEKSTDSQICHLYTSPRPRD